MLNLGWQITRPRRINEKAKTGGWEAPQGIRNWAWQGKEGPAKDVECFAVLARMKAKNENSIWMWAFSTSHLHCNVLIPWTHWWMAGSELRLEQSRLWVLTLISLKVCNKPSAFPFDLPCCKYLMASIKSNTWVVKTLNFRRLARILLI